MRDRSLFKSATIGLLALWLGIFVLIPNLMILATSFLRRSEADFIEAVFTLENYRKLFDPIYFRVFAHSTLLALAATLLCLLIGYPFAYRLARLKNRWRPVLLVLVIIPFWTNSLIRTYAIKTILATKGLLNGVLMGLGIIDAPLRLLYTSSAVTIGMVYVLLPFMILPLYAVIEKLDPSQIEAASDLGATRLQAFFRVVIPLTMPGIIAGSLLVFLPALGMFYIADLLGGAKDLLIGNFIKNQFLDARDWPFGAAASVSMTLAMALILLAYYRSVRRLNSGGI